MITDKNGTVGADVMTGAAEGSMVGEGSTCVGKGVGCATVGKSVGVRLTLGTGVGFKDGGALGDA